VDEVAGEGVFIFPKAIIKKEREREEKGGVPFGGNAITTPHSLSLSLSLTHTPSPIYKQKR